ncbi:hypothetical protein VRZ08_12435 [Rhodopseudomonas sp. G2_2311]|uniref:RraA family protein n=1 Tax=Rhodopseudomonas sp. G2_2311 TaxID=3114287 RepID=UPI0039C6D2EF
MTVIAFVPAKGTSARIENKNLRILDGELLFKRKLRQLLDCPDIDLVCLDTESDEIAALASDLPIQRLARPTSLATNATDGHEMFAWECAQVEADFYVQSLCTAPFVTAATVSRALALLKQSPEHDSLVAVSRGKQYLWGDGKPLYGRDRIPNSVDLPETVVEAMSLYIVRGETARAGKRFGLTPLLFELDPTELIDVNWPEDLVLAETVAAGERARENLALTALAPYLTSSLLSDVTRELGLAQALPREIAGRSRFFGRAKTLQLDVVGEGETWRGIYDALKSYDFVRPGDVITVENRVREHAYFGELNAQIAMRSGAVGAVIDGVTRDVDEVRRLGFPVFARGRHCLDIKFKGVLRAMNFPIEIGGVSISNGDYIFADADGVVAIPRTKWPEVRAATLIGIEKEWRVGMSVALGRPAMEIFNELGEF